MMYLLNELLSSCFKKRNSMGSNEWQTANEWPPADAVNTIFYLDSEGSENSRNGDAKLVKKAPLSNNKDTFTYDPMDPVPSYGGNVCCTGNAVQGGAFDQREMELRDDILVYTLEPPLEEDIEVSGFIKSRLYLSSDVKDTGVTIKLIDVYRMAEHIILTKPYSALLPQEIR